MATFPSGDDEAVWAALFCACDLCRLVATEIANHFAFCYPSADDMAMTAYLHRVRNMPDGEVVIT